MFNKSKYLMLLFILVGLDCVFEVQKAEATCVWNRVWNCYSGSFFCRNSCSRRTGMILDRSVVDLSCNELAASTSANDLEYVESLDPRKAQIRAENAELRRTSQRMRCSVESQIATLPTNGAS